LGIHIFALLVGGAVLGGAGRIRRVQIENHQTRWFELSAPNELKPTATLESGPRHLLVSVACLSV
jgi:hypothetical protein